MFTSMYEAQKMEKKYFTAPKDKMKIVFFIFLLHGLGTLMPWNMFITAKSVSIIHVYKYMYMYILFIALTLTLLQYFVDFKLASTEANVTTAYASNFMQYIGFASQIPNLIFNWLNIFVHLG